MGYPENGAVQGLGDYDLFTGYLHTKGLRWSYGAVRGRRSDWRATPTRCPPPSSRPPPPAAGFGAVYLDRVGYADGGAATAAALDGLAGPAASGLSASAFGSSSSTCARPPRAWRPRRPPLSGRCISNALLYPVALGFGDGFSYSAAGQLPFAGSGPVRG